jgi:hypothetical protein
VGGLGDEGPDQIRTASAKEANTVSERTLTRDTGRVVSDNVEAVSLMAISFKTDTGSGDLRNTGTEPLLAIAFFSGPALTQDFDDTMLPVNGHVLSSPNVTS